MICFTLMVGLLIGGGTLGFLGLTKAGAGVQPAPTTAAPTQLTDVFSVMVPVFSVISFVVAVWLPSLMVRQTRKRWEARADDEAAMRRVYGEFAGATIVRAALLEGSGLFGATATYLTGNWLILLATLGSVVMLAVFFPRTSLINRWIEDATGQLPHSPFAPNLSDDEAA